MKRFAQIRSLVRRPSAAALSVGVAAVALAAGCTPAPSGNGADYALSYWGGQVVRWNPCAPVHYVVNTNEAPSAAAEVQADVARLSAATGISFVYDGTTSFVPQSTNLSNEPTQLVIAFSHSGAGGSDRLGGGNQVGDGGWDAVGSFVNGRLVPQISHGFVVVDAPSWSRLSPTMQRSVVLHELGHAVGLQHAKLRTEVMYPTVYPDSPSDYSAGDLAGLRAVGRPAGCIG